MIHGVLNELAGLKKGPIKIEDCWSMVPFENFVGVFEVTPAELREILEENARELLALSFHWRLWHEACAAGHGAAWPSGSFPMTDRAGEPFAPGRRLRVAVNSFDLAGAGTRKARLRAIADAPQAKLVEIDYPVRQAVMDFIAAKREISPRVYGWWRTGAAR